MVGYLEFRALSGFRMNKCTHAGFIFDSGSRLPLLWLLSWPAFNQQLRDLEKMLGKRYMREHFIASCIGNSGDVDLLRSWTSHMQGLRWEAIAKFCADVAMLSLQTQCWICLGSLMFVLESRPRIVYCLYMQWHFSHSVWTDWVAPHRSSFEKMVEQGQIHEQETFQTTCDAFGVGTRIWDT